MIRLPSCVILALAALCACRADEPRDTAAAAPPRTPRAIADAAMDVHSFARPAAVRVTHVDLDLVADFEARCVRGTAALTLARRDPVAPLVCDTGDGLEVEAVTGADGSVRQFHLGKPDEIRGRALVVQLEPDDERVTIRYATRPEAGALQWLDPEQTDGGRLPFLYTQGQAILTRSWIPLQDSPGVRVTYEATIRAPDDLVAVMSAQNREVVEPGVTRFSMPKPIPSYLIALAIGDLARRPISPRCAVWAEPGIVERAAAEFEDVETMLVTCEALYGPYVWGRYDVLVLPPSFPFGGMENPCLTFATPTILAGDKSLVALIAHELAHSWSGNLVTNATWRDFWLNEGFTVYVEQRIVEALYGKERANMETLIGLQGLERALAELPDADEILHVDLTGRDPDDGMTPVPYDKGAAFLRRLEEVFGRARFDAFLQTWFSTHSFQSVTTDEFLRWLDRELLSKHAQLADAVDVRRWVFEPGLPETTPRPESPGLERVDAARNRWLDGSPASELGAGAWGTMQWIHFLDAVPNDVPSDRLRELDATYGLTGVGNSEVLVAWLRLNLRVGFDRMPPNVADRLERFLLHVGRRKFLEPLYKGLAGSPAGLERARQIYAAARPRYHAVSTRTIDGILGWPQ